MRASLALSSFSALHFLPSLFCQKRRFGVFQLFLAPPVAAFLDEAPCLGEIGLSALPRIGQRLAFFRPSEQSGASDENISHEKTHRAALGYFPRLVQVALRAIGADGCAGEKAQPSTGE